MYPVKYGLNSVVTAVYCQDTIVTFISARLYYVFNTFSNVPLRSTTYCLVSIRLNAILVLGIGMLFQVLTTLRNVFLPLSTFYREPQGSSRESYVSQMSVILYANVNHLVHAYVARCLRKETSKAPRIPDLSLR